MDFQNRVGGKTGSGGPLNYSESNAERRERMRRLALETIDLANDPFFMKNHLGIYECRLCLTLHNNEANYLSHTQGKKHQSNLARRTAKEAALAAANPQVTTTLANSPVFMSATAAASSAQSQKNTIGVPTVKTHVLRDPETQNWGLMLMFSYPSAPESTPEHRIMSAFEQKVEVPNKNFMYVAAAAEPFETAAVRVPFREVLDSFAYWDVDSRILFVQIMFNSKD